MLTATRNRWRRFKSLLADRWFLSFFYGEGLRAHPLNVAAKMLAARLVFVVPLPFDTFQGMPSTANQDPSGIKQSRFGDTSLSAVQDYLRASLL